MTERMPKYHFTNDQNHFFKTMIQRLVFVLLFLLYLSLGTSQISDLTLDHISDQINHSHYGTGGGGISTVDFNQDGYQDISLAGSAGELSTFILNVNGELIDTVLTGIDNTFEVRQILWVDIDNDHDLDVFLTCKAGVSQLYINSGNLTFTNQTIAFNLDTSIRNYIGATFMDFDRDGYLDLYLAERPNANLEGENRFRLYRNIRGKTFDEITEECNCDDLGKRPFGSLVIDLNRDLYPDILNAHDRGNGLSLFQNWEGEFSNITATANVDIEMDAMGMSPSDVNIDGALDIYVTNIAEGNKLLIKDQNNSRYEEGSKTWNVEHKVLSWGTLFLDLDNNGTEELYVANSVSGSQYPNLIYVNQGDEFTPTSIQGDTLTNYSCAYIDLYNDGVKHIINAGVRENKTALLFNTTPQGNYIDIVLQGEKSNKSGIGSWVEVHRDSTIISTYYQNIEGFLSQQPFTQSIGLGNNEQIDTIKVVWPTGHTDVLTDIEPNQRITIKEGQSTNGLIAIDSSIQHHYNEPTLFLEASDSLNIDHYVRHQGFNGGGCAFIDTDNDGYDDLYLIGGAEKDALYLNKDGVFEEAGFLSGIAITENFYTTGVASGDLNNDGLEDLFITTHGSNQLTAKNLLLFNKGNNEFEDVWPIIDTIDASSAVILIDYNQDGLLDIYTLNYVNDAGFLEDSEGTIIGYDHTCYENRLYQNLGNFQFEDVTQNQLDDALNQACSLAALGTDFDQDRDQDILVGNDFGLDIIGNTILVNNNNESLSAASDLGFIDAIFSMGISGSDLDNDLDVDYYVTNFGENIFVRNDENALTTLGGLTASSTYNSLDSTDLSISWGTVIEDFNNDGNSDVFVGNGYVPSPDYLPGRVSDNDRLYLGNGDFDFIELSPDFSGIDNVESTRGVASSDFDGDGDIDLAINIMRVPINGNSKSKVYLNQLIPSDTSHWVQLKLEGLKSNKSGCGARVDLYSQGHMHSKEIYCGSSHASSNSKVLHFGLGNHSVVDSLNIYWPNNKQTIDTYYQFEANRLYHILEDTSLWSVDTMVIDTTMIDTMEVDTIEIGDDGPSVYPEEDQVFVVSNTLEFSTDQALTWIYPNPVSRSNRMKVYAIKEIMNLNVYDNLGHRQPIRIHQVLTNNQELKSYFLHPPEVPGIYSVITQLIDGQLSVQKLVVY